MEPWYVCCCGNCLENLYSQEVERNPFMISGNCFMKENNLLVHNSDILYQQCYFLLSCYLLLLFEYQKNQ